MWGGGFLGAGGLHAVDFAGGSVVHELAGASALATVIYLGKRKSYERPHNVPLVLLGAGILWFGWFGFNAGSAGSAGTVAVSALVNTQIGASAGMLAWMAIEWLRRRKPSGVGLAAGAVAGLAAITPASGYVPTWAALVIGGAAGVLCYLAVELKNRLRYDDALDVVGVHMVGGFIGVILTGVFASLAVNALGVAGRHRAVRPPVRPCARGARLSVRADLRHPVGDGQDRGPAGERGRPGRRSRPLSEHDEVAYEWPWETIEGRPVVTVRGGVPESPLEPSPT